MPGALVVAVIAAVAVVLVILVLRARGKAAEPAEPRFQPPREIAKRPPKDAAGEAPASAEAPPPVSTKGNTPAMAFPPSSVPAAPATPPVLEAQGEEEATRIDAMPASSDEIAADQILETESAPAARPPAPSIPPPLPRESRPTNRPPLPSYSDITDEAVASTPSPAVADKPTAPPPASEPKVAAAESPALKVPAPPRVPASEPKVAAKAPAAPKSEPKFAPAAKSEPKIPPAAKSEPKAPPPVAAKSEPKIPPAPRADEHDFSALNDPPAAKKETAPARIPAAAKYAPPANPATADLEKSDPRHAAARRLARVSVSEIKLYHEDEVKAGREANDLWKRLSQDIALARQTFDGRVDKEVRERFDYLYDEILRQLAEGDAKRLGPDAPAPGGAAPAPEPPKDPSEPKLEIPATPEPVKVDEAPKPEPAKVEAPKPEPAKAEAPKVEAPKAEPAKAAAPKAEPPKGPSGLAARMQPANPETAELEKNDPRHAAARRLARLSVSEIKLYHEDEVTAGREAKDLWKRMAADIGLALQTYEKRVDKEVRDRFDYLYDEILRQLAEGDVAKLGPEAPAPKKAEPPKPEPAKVEEPAAAAPAAAAPKAEEPKPAAAPATGLAARFAQPSNPATAELEKNDPRHAAARRLARLSVSEIKLYHEDEVKAGREAKDLWKRLITDIGLATQTYEKRVDKEVRERFDYLYDEILRQLAEGDVTKLGADAPKKN